MPHKDTGDRNIRIFSGPLKMVLMGLTPDKCLAAAGIAIEFWQNQMMETCNGYESLLHSAEEQVAVSRGYKTVNEQLSAENSLLKRQLQRESTAGARFCFMCFCLASRVLETWFSLRLQK